MEAQIHTKPTLRWQRKRLPRIGKRLLISTSHLARMDFGTLPLLVYLVEPTSFAIRNLGAGNS